MVYYKLILFFSKGIGSAPITNENYPESLQGKTAKQGFEDYHIVSHGAVHSAASSYAAIRMVAGSRPVLIIV